MLTEATFRQNLNHLAADAENATFLLAVSGGADSMVLSRLFLRSGLKFHAAHVNYKLRGEDSDADQRLVENFCSENRIPLHLYEVSEKDEKPEGSVQVWARDLRYDFFKNIKKTNDLDYIVTAHHLNDQLETFLINLSRATGLQGLSGIPADRNGIIRPMLSFTKEQIYVFAKAENIKFREDLSNRKNDYLRNFIRNEISPVLIKTNPNFLENFKKSIENLRETNEFVSHQISKIEGEIIREENGLVFINKKSVLRESGFVQFEILRKFGFDAQEEIKKIFAAPKGKIFKSASFTVEVDREFFIIKDKKHAHARENTDEIIITEILPPNLTIDLSRFIEKQPGSKKIIWEIDPAKIDFPLKLRKKQAGDLFYPVGMSGRKTIAKFFKDQKIPTFAQQNIWLLSDSKNNILGVVPIRQDRRFAANADYQNKIRIAI